MTPKAALRRFVTTADQQAFAAVVTQFTPLVYSLAVRRCRQPDIAAEIAQDVFLTCARKASILVARGTALGPWLHRATLLETMNHLRKEATHQRHAAAAAQEPIEASGCTREWDDVLPHLDDALNGLDDRDRTAVLLRYYSGHSFSEIGNAMGRTEDAARKLCTRAVEKLNRALRRRGVALPTALIADGLATHWSAAAAVPSGLVAKISAHVAANFTASGTTCLLSALTIMKTSPVPLTAAALLLIAAPAAWQWQEQRTVQAGIDRLELTITQLPPAKVVAKKTKAETAPSLISTTTASLTPERIRETFSRLLTLRATKRAG
jgi:RNA polymerase sigma factor (sigma-70 family)